jgi:hypothetical protein
MANLIAKLLLDLKGWDGNIGKASADMRKLNDTAKTATTALDNMSGGLLSSVKTWASWGAAGAAAYKVITDAYMSSETQADSWRATQEACKGVYEEFIATLNSGSWDGFFNRISKAIEDSKALYNELDRLGSIRANNSYATQSVRAEIAKIRTDIKAAQASGDTKKLQALQADLRKKGAEYSTLLGQEIEQARKAGRQGVLDSFKGYNISAKEAEQLADGIINQGQAFYDAQQAVYERLKKKGTVTVEKVIGSGQFGGGQSVTTTAFDASQLTKRELRLFERARAVIENESSPERMEGLKVLTEAVGKAEQAANFGREMSESLNAKAASVSGASGGKSGGEMAEELRKGSFAFIEKMIADLKKQRNSTPDVAEIQRIDREIAQLVKEKIDLNLSIAGKNIPTLSPISGTVEGFTPLNVPTITPVVPVDTSKTKEGNDMLAKTVELMGSLSQVTSGSASNWIAWGASLVQTVAQALPALESLFVALQATAAGSAAAENSKAGPFGWVAGIAAMMSIVAAFATLPKFATGGIVGGSAYNGDRTLIRVNSGEMVLNSMQQARLFSMIDGGGVGGDREIRLRISGSDLVGAINNYGRKAAKM